MGGIEGHGTGKAKPMAQTGLGVIPLIRGDAPNLLGRRYVLAQGSIVPFFDTHNIMEVVSLQTLDMGSVRTPAVFGDAHLEVRMVLAQLRDEGVLPTSPRETRFSMAYSHP